MIVKASPESGALGKLDPTVTNPVVSVTLRYPVICRFACALGPVVKQANNVNQSPSSGTFAPPERETTNDRSVGLGSVTVPKAARPSNVVLAGGDGVKVLPSQ